MFARIETEQIAGSSSHDESKASATERRHRCFASRFSTPRFVKCIRDLSGEILKRATVEACARPARNWGPMIE